MIYITDNLIGKLPVLMKVPEAPLDGVTFVKTKRSNLLNSNFEENPSLSWGMGVGRGFKVTGEHGFFRNATWLDNQGIYQDSSLNTEEGYRTVMDYVPPEDITDQIVNSQINTKYSQPMNSIKWTGVVLAAQNPLDCNIGYSKPFIIEPLKGHDAYMSWFIEQCKYYGKYLLVKIHPFVQEIPQWGKIFVDIADRYGCSAAICNMDCLEHADKVITYTSTIALDCWMRGIPCELSAEGTFSKFSVKEAKHLANFLAWKYCIPTNIKLEKFLELIKTFSTSKERYPLPKDCSWGEWFITTTGEDGVNEQFSSTDTCLPRQPHSNRRESIVSGEFRYNN